MLAQNLRGISSPDALNALLPALASDYGRASPVLDELIDAVGRLAQPDTVEAISAMHSDASTKGAQSQQLLRAMTAVHNDAALPGLVRVAETSDSEALAQATLSSMNAIGANAVDLKALQ